MTRLILLFRGLLARRPSRRAVLATVAATGLLVLLAHPVAGADSDLFQNIGPASQVPGGALMDAYPLGRYGLDHHFSAVKAGVFSGVDVSGIPPTIAWMLAHLLWTITAFLAQTVITVFTFAFSLDLLGGSTATGGHGALQPVSRAVRSIYQTTFGQPWLVVAILLAGLWAIYQALVRRRYTETAGSLALSVVLVLIALAFVSQPERTIGSASRLSNEMSGAFLSLTSKGTITDQGQAKQNAADQLFSLLVYRPWAVLEFGGLEHCVHTPVDGDHPVSVAVRPLAGSPSRDAQLAATLRRTGQIQTGSKVCVDNERKYAAHFLRFGLGSDQRNKEHDALAAGDAGKLPDADPGKKTGAYRLSAADKPAADAMGKDGQYQRLLLALVVFVAELGAVCLLGALSIAVILAQVLVLLLLAFAPVALVVAVFPGRGHEFFLGWLTRLGAFLLRKAIYSLILAVLLAVAAALSEATSSLGWLMAFGLQAVFFWSVFLSRHKLVGQLTLATTGHAASNDGALRIAALYGAAHAAKGLLTRHRTPPPPPPQDISLVLPEDYQPPTTPQPPPATDPDAPSAPDAPGTASTPPVVAHDPAADRDTAPGERADAEDPPPAPALAPEAEETPPPAAQPEPPGPRDLPDPPSSPPDDAPSLDMPEVRPQTQPGTAPRHAPDRSSRRDEQPDGSSLPPTTAGPAEHPDVSAAQPPTHPSDPQTHDGDGARSPLRHDLDTDGVAAGESAAAVPAPPTPTVGPRTEDHAASPAPEQRPADPAAEPPPTASPRRHPEVAGTPDRSEAPDRLDPQAPDAPDPARPPREDHA